MIDKTNIAANDVRLKLQEMEKENKKLEKGTAEYRIRTNMHGTLTKNFLELMTKYQEIQSKYKRKFKEKVERQILIGKKKSFFTKKKKEPKIEFQTKKKM